MEYLPEVIAGLFALLSAYLAWRLGEQSQAASIMREKRKEKEHLYESIYEAFERTTIEILGGKDRESVPKIISLNSKVALHAKADIADKYFQCCTLLEEWSELYDKANPKTKFVQSPDPAEKWKQPAKEAYEKLQPALKELADLMKQDLAAT